MRPRSITGPLILVLIGVVFLLNNLGHNLPVWSLAWDYWPILLVVLGVIGLVEVLYHVGRGGAPMRGFGGGGIFWIVVLIGFFSWAGHRGNVHIGPFTNGGVNILGSDYEYDVNATGASQGVSRLVLDNVHGNISLKGEEGNGDVKVSGRKTIRAFSRTDADRANQQSNIRVDRQGDLLIVHAEDPSGSRMLSVTTDLDITVPKTLDIEARGRTGDFTADSVGGSVDVVSGRGDIRLTGIGKDVKIEASRTGLVRASGVKGNLDVTSHSGNDVQIDNITGQVTINGEYSGNLEFGQISKSFHFQSRQSDFRVEKLPGTITMDLSDLKINNALGPVRFKTGSRDVHVTDTTDSLELDLNRGDIEIIQTKTPLPKMDVHTRNGDIALAIPAAAAYEIEGKTRNGDTNNEFGDPFHTDRDGRGGTIKGKSGISGPQISLETERGTVTVRKN